MKNVKLNDAQIEYILAALGEKLEEAADQGKSLVCEAIEKTMDAFDTAEDV